MEVIIKNFDELSAEEVYQVLALRTDIFVVEQECAYQEVDGFDQASQHFLGMDGGKLVAYARNVPPKQVYNEPSIGRVAVHKDYRQKGYGRIIFRAALSELIKSYPEQTLKIQAQVYLEGFYQSFGFKTVTEPYPDFGIWHVDMLLTHQS